MKMWFEICLEIYPDVWHWDDEEEREYFFKKVLSVREYNLLLHSNEIDDVVGIITKIRKIEPGPEPTFAVPEEVLKKQFTI